jgi:uncharacterized protein YhaN
MNFLQRNFLVHIAIALLLLAGGALFRFVVPWGGAWTGEYAFLAGTFGAQFWLFIAAIGLRSRDIPGFDMLVAAEIIIAMGVFSLILGLGTAVFLAVESSAQITTFELSAMGPFLLPFGEGLLAAGLAPLLASVLRQIEVLNYSNKERDPGADLHDDLAQLSTTVRTASKSVGALIAKVDESTSTFEQSTDAFNAGAETFKKATSRYENVVGRIAQATETHTDKVEATIAQHVEQIKALTEDFASKINAADASVRASLQKTSDAAGGLSTKFDEAGGKTRELTDEIDRLKKEIRQTTPLLDGLQKLIESVNRFIRPAA